MLDVTALPILQDNYAFIIRSGNEVGVIDPGEAVPFIKALDRIGGKLDWVINTHHHWDHTNGNKELIDRYGAKWAAPAECGVPDVVLEEGESFCFGDAEFEIIHVKGHTAGHVCLYRSEDKVLFSGDALFAMGCGRLFEGSADDMFDGLQKLKSLPQDTQIYFGHEYTHTNGQFAAHILPDNQDIVTRVQSLEGQTCTIPTHLDIELKTNPFLLAQTAEEFAEFRRAKDDF